MLNIKLFVVMFLFVAGKCEEVGTTCLACQGVMSPTECGFVVECGVNQHCYTEAYVTARGLMYNLGCRNRTQCSQFDSAAQGLIGKKSTGILACSQCCEGKLCNSAGCGSEGYSANWGPVCYSCSDQLNEGDCRNITVCGRDEVCSISQTTDFANREQRYQTKCENSKVCDNELKLIQMLNPNPDSCLINCCTDDLCNSKCSSNIATSAFSTSTAPPTVYHCMSNPCVHGACVENNDTYTCNCYAGASGQRCEILLTTFPVATATSPSGTTTSSPTPEPSKTTTTSPPQTTTTTMTTTTTSTTSTTTTATTKGTTTARPSSCTSNYCLNNGRCVVENNIANCQCQPKYTGQYCEKSRSCESPPFNLATFSTSNNGHGVHYTIIQERMTQSEAYNYCQAHCFGTLAQLKSYQKFETLRLQLQRTNFNSDFWIDGIYNHTSGHWVTSDGQQMTEDHRAWYFENTWGTAGDCVRLTKDNDFHFNDADCNVPHGLICEYFF